MFPLRSTRAFALSCKLALKRSHLRSLRYNASVHLSDVCRSKCAPKYVITRSFRTSAFSLDRSGDSGSDDVSVTTLCCPQCDNIIPMLRQHIVNLDVKCKKCGISMEEKPLSDVSLRDDATWPIDQSSLPIEDNPNINDKTKMVEDRAMFRDYKPRELREYLDRHVIGQLRAKMMLAVIMYNHLKRVSLMSVVSDNSDTDSKTIKERKKRKTSSGNNAGKQTSKQAKSVNPPPAPPVDDILARIEKKATATAAATPVEFTDNEAQLQLDKTNAIVIGPTGSGKTFIAQLLAKRLSVPFVIADCTSLTQAGYVGEDVQSVISKLFAEAGNDVDLCQRGIVFLDEIDKLCGLPSEFSEQRDISGRGVQEALLKLVEGGKVAIKSTTRAGEILVDTKNITFIGSGAFPGLDKIIAKRLKKCSIGFSQQIGTDGKEFTAEIDDLLSKVTTEDLVRYGFIPEFIGRFPVPISMDSLKLDDLRRILVEPENCLLKQYEFLFALDDCLLEIPTETLLAIASQAQERGTGARGLRSIMEAALMNAMYQIPGSDYEKVVLHPECITDGRQPTLLSKTGSLTSLEPQSMLGSSSPIDSKNTQSTAHNLP